MAAAIRMVGNLRLVPKREFCPVALPLFSFSNKSGFFKSSFHIGIVGRRKQGAPMLRQQFRNDAMRQIIVPMVRINCDITKFLNVRREIDPTLCRNPCGVCPTYAFYSSDADNLISFVGKY